MKDIYSGEQLIILGVNSFKKLGVDYIPLELVLNSTANVQSVFVIGRNNPYYQYNSGEDTLTLQLDFHAKQDDLNDVKEKCNWLRSLRYSGQNTESEKIKLIMGDVFEREVWVVKSCNIKYSHFMRDKNLRPKQAYVELSLGLDGLSSGTNERNYIPKAIYKDDISR
jgi:hypothetical protein